MLAGRLPCPQRPRRPIALEHPDLDVERRLAGHLRDVILAAYLRDTVNARELLPDGSYRRIEPKAGEAPFDVQAWLLECYKAPRPLRAG